MGILNETLNFISSHIVPQSIGLLKNNAVLICTILFIALMVYLGWRKGIMLKLVSFGSLLLTLVAEIAAFPYILQRLQSIDGIDELYQSVGNAVLHLDPAKARSHLYRLFRLDMLAENAGEMLGILAAKIILFVVIFIIIRIMLKVVTGLIKGLRQVRIISRVDSFFGAAVGFFESILYIWVFMFAISALTRFELAVHILDQITASPILLEIYNNNLIVDFLKDMVL